MSGRTISPAHTIQTDGLSNRSLVRFSFHCAYSFCPSSLSKYALIDGKIQLARDSITSSGISNLNLSADMMPAPFLLHINSYLHIQLSKIISRAHRAFCYCDAYGVVLRVLLGLLRKCLK